MMIGNYVFSHAINELFSAIMNENNRVSHSTLYHVGQNYNTRRNLLGNLFLGISGNNYTDDYPGKILGIFFFGPFR